MAIPHEIDPACLPGPSDVAFPGTREPDGWLDAPARDQLIVRPDFLPAATVDALCDEVHAVRLEQARIGRAGERHRGRSNPLARLDRF